MADRTAKPTPSSLAATGAPGGEIALRASLLDALDEAVIGTDPGGHIIYWNDAAERLYGWRADEVLGADVLDITPAEGMADEAAAIMTRLQRGESWAGEFLVTARDGRVFPARVTNSPVRDADGRLIGIVGVSRDVSLHQQEREALRESEERLELVHRAASSVIWEWDLRADHIHWSDAVGDSFGYPAQEIEPTLDWWEERIHPDDRERVVRELWNFVSSGRRFYTAEYRLRTASGSYATVFARAHLAMGPHGRPTRLVGTLLDLTARKRNQENQRFLAQASMMLELSLDYQALLPGIARLATHEFAGCAVIHIAAHDGVPPLTAAVHGDPRRQALVEAFAPLLELGPGQRSEVMRLLWNGESVLIPDCDHGRGRAPLPTELTAIASGLDAASLIVAPVAARRSVLGVMLLARFHDARRFDNDDLRVAEELGRRAGLAVDNARLTHSAALANRAKTDFLAVVNHELRTPLTAVRSYADLLAAELGGPLTAAQKRHVNGIRTGSSRLLRLIEDILLFARLETGREQPTLTHVSLQPLLDQVAALIRPQAAEKGLEFQLHLRDLPASGCTDADKLVQILLALLTNAVKFSERGTVILDVSARNGDLVFDVTDTGTGIPEEHLPHVFNPFWQVEQPATRRAGGAGLGLSVARRLARLLGGDVIAARTSSRGSTFRLTLPARPDG